MVPVTSLWLPILLSGVVVFIASSILHMVLPYHRNDVRGLPADKEDEVLDTLRRAGLPPGDYCAPYAGSMAGMTDPAFVAKMSRGPVAILTIASSGSPSVTSNLVHWFIYSLVVSVFSAYAAGLAAGPGASYMAVFRVVSTATFMGYALALPQRSIWYRWSWRTTLLSMGDGVIYGLLTGGVFGWLWPR
jgi:hypothetical protein